MDRHMVLLPEAVPRSLLSAVRVRPFSGYSVRKAQGGARPGRSHVRTMLRTTRSRGGRQGAGPPAGAPGSGLRDALERLLEQARPHRPRRLARRELRLEAISAAALLVVAAGLAAVVSSPRSLSPATLALYAGLYVAA